MLTKDDILAERYVIEERVGSGGYGSVYRARDRKKGSLVAIKVLRSDLADDPDFRRRFRREADIARLLTGEHVVKVLDTGDSRVGNEDVYFQVMEFVEGGTLQDRLKKGQIPIRKALYVAAQMAEALEEAESRGIVHCDIKPRNIFVGKGEFARLGDFGVARATEYPSLKPDDPILGTPRYMSPEQCLGHETDVRSDIYSLGVVLYEMIAGKPPFEGDSPNVIAFKQVNEKAKPLKKLSQHVSEEVQQIVDRCLQKRPEDRFQHASELRAALWEAIESVSSAEDTPITPAGLKARWFPIKYRARRLVRIPPARLFLPVALAIALATMIPLLGPAAVGWMADEQATEGPLAEALTNSRLLETGGPRGAAIYRYEPRFPSRVDAPAASCRERSMVSSRADAYTCSLAETPGISLTLCFLNGDRTVGACPVNGPERPPTFIKVTSSVRSYWAGSDTVWHATLDVEWVGLESQCELLAFADDLKSGRVHAEFAVEILAIRPTDYLFLCDAPGGSSTLCSAPEAEGDDLIVLCYPYADDGDYDEVSQKVLRAWY